MSQRCIELDGRTYQWTGREWYDAATNMKPPRTVLHKLESLLASEPIGLGDKLALGKKVRAEGNLWLAEHLARDILREHPRHQNAAALLSGVLRDRKEPERALTVTAPFTDGADAAIFTTRAAALCDLERWEDARKEIGRALAIGGDEEAFAVVRRIKKVRPDLYPD